MAVTGWKFPGSSVGNRTVTNADDNWSNPTNNQADDGSSASVLMAAIPDSSFGLTATNFSFSGDIPAGSTIDGIEARIGDYAEAGVHVAFLDVRLILADNTDGVLNKNTDPSVPTDTLQTSDVGGATDTWTENITRADVIDADFGFFISIGALGSAASLTVDFMQMRIHYTIPTVGLKIESALVDILDSITTQDIVISGFGVPVGAIFHWITAEAQAPFGGGNASVSVGYFDGTRNRCVGASIKDAVTTTQTDRHQSDIRCGVLWNPSAGGGSGAITGEISGIQFITDGVRIDIPTTPGSQWQCIVTLFGGDHIANFYCNHWDDLGTGTAAVNITDPGFQADLVFIDCVGSNVLVTGNDNQTHAILASGVWSRDDAVQLFNSMSSEDAAATSDGSAHNSSVANDKGVAQSDWTGVQWEGDLDAHASGFSVTPDSSASSDIIFYCAIEWATTPDVEIVLSSLPLTADTDWVEAGFTFQPEWGMSSFGGAIIAGAIDQTPTPILMSYHTYESGQVLSVGISETNNVGTTESAVWGKSTFFIGDPDGTTELSNGTLASLDTNGWTIDFSPSEHQGMLRKGWSLAIKQGVAAGLDPYEVLFQPQPCTLTRM